MRELSRHSRNRGAFFPRRLRIRFEAAQAVSGRADSRIRRRSSGANAFARRRGEHGSAILETFLSMSLLGMILFGVLQIFQLAVTDMVTDYAAFRGARSAAVGFKDEYAYREAKIKVAPVSGSLISPDHASWWNSVETEKSLLRGYMEDINDLDYAYWGGEEIIHTNYLCPKYGQYWMASEDPCEHCGRRTGREHTIGYEISRTQKGRAHFVTFSLSFDNYPLNIPLHDWLTGKDFINISGEAELQDFSGSVRQMGGED